MSEHPYEADRGAQRASSQSMDTGCATVLGGVMFSVSGKEKRIEKVRMDHLTGQTGRCYGFTRSTRRTLHR